MLTVRISGLDATVAAHAGALGDAVEAALVPFGNFTREAKTLSVSAPLDMVPTSQQWLIEASVRFVPQGTEEIKDEDALCAAIGKALEAKIKGGLVLVHLAYIMHPAYTGSYMTEVPKVVAKNLSMFPAKDVAAANEAFARGVDIVWLPSPIPGAAGHCILVSPAHSEFFGLLKKSPNFEDRDPPVLRNTMVNGIPVKVLYFKNTLAEEAAPGVIEDLVTGVPGYTVQYG